MVDGVDGADVGVVEVLVVGYDVGLVDDGVEGEDVVVIEVLVVGYGVGLVEVGDDGTDVEGMVGLAVGGRDGIPTTLAGLFVGMALG